MEPILVKVLDNLSLEGFDVPGDEYECGPDISDTETHAIFVRSAKILDMNKYPKLRLIIRVGIGVDTINIPAATQRGIQISNTGPATAGAVSEMVFAALGSHARNYRKSEAFVRSICAKDDESLRKQVEAGKSRHTGFELAGKTLAVIGLGNIGVLVANGGIARYMNVVGYDPSVTPDNMHQLDRWVKRVDMRTALSVADIVTVHVPLIEGNNGLIGKDQCAQMKDGCIVINYARKEIVDTVAMLDALDNGKVSAYLTDFAVMALRRHKRVHTSAHDGANTPEAQTRAMIMAIRQLVDYFEHGIVHNSVNFPNIDLLRPNTGETGVSRVIIINDNVLNIIRDVKNILGDTRLNVQSEIHKTRNSIGYGVIDLEGEISPEVIEKIRGLKGILHARAIWFPREQ